MSPVPATHSQLIDDALENSGVRRLSARPETWLVHLIRHAEDDPEMTLVGLAREEEGVGISAAAGVPRTATVDAVGPAGFVTDPGLLENRFVFARALRREPTA